MDKTQHFRLAGTNAIKKIPYEPVDEHNVIFWEDIERVFPGVEQVEYDGAVVNLLRGPDQQRIRPHRIKHHPSVVLDVVLSSLDEDASATVVESLQVTQLSADTSSGDDEGEHTLSRTTATMLPSTTITTTTTTTTTALSGFKRKTSKDSLLPYKEMGTLSQKDFLESETEQQLVSIHPSDLQVQVLASTNTQEFFHQVTQKGGQMYQQNEQLIASLRNLDDRTMNIESMASKIMELASKNNELLSKNYKLTSENKDQLAHIS
ncbi:hypothetical protein BGX34_003612, partial [Mortierella sp. NVP85]